jgi:hypothetical protein
MPNGISIAMAPKPETGVWGYQRRASSPRVRGHRSVLARSEQIADSGPRFGS